jgi:aspartate 1-decarboxylase
VRPLIRARKDDIIIIAGYGVYSEDEIGEHHPSLAYVDEDNRIVAVNSDS